MSSSQDRDLVRLKHILEYAVEATEMAKGRERQDLNGDRQFGLAMTRLLEIIGEAAAHVSTETRNRMTDVPWLQIVGLRNRLIHGYDEVDFDVLWAVVQGDLPSLIASVQIGLEGYGTRDSS